jgi:hypothetical protein
MEWSERDHYFFMRISQVVYLFVGIGMVLPSKRFLGGRPRYFRIRVVKLDINDTLTCSCKDHKRFGISFRHIIAIVGDVI